MPRQHGAEAARLVIGLAAVVANDSTTSPEAIARSPLAKGAGFAVH
jgi:hypothetical protein